MTSVGSHETSEFDECGHEVSTGASSRPTFVRLAGMTVNGADSCGASRGIVFFNPLCYNQHITLFPKGDSAYE